MNKKKTIQIKDEPDIVRMDDNESSIFNTVSPKPIDRT